jgi:hypothetical protein
MRLRCHCARTTAAGRNRSNPRARRNGIASGERAVRRTGPVASAVMAVGGRRVSQAGRQSRLLPARRDIIARRTGPRAGHQTIIERRQARLSPNH